MSLMYKVFSADHGIRISIDTLPSHTYDLLPSPVQTVGAPILAHARRLRARQRMYSSILPEPVVTARRTDRAD